LGLRKPMRRVLSQERDEARAAKLSVSAARSAVRAAPAVTPFSRSGALPVSRLSCAGNEVKWSLRGRSPGARNGAEWTCQLRSSSQAPMRRPVP
jgi:hypothetical protein